MEQAEKRTLMRTIFSKLKGYYKYRKGLIPSRIRANVHFRIKISSKVLKTLQNYKNLRLNKQKLSQKSKRHHELKLKDKGLSSIVINLLKRRENGKKKVKANWFYKYQLLCRVFLLWKRYKFVIIRADEVKKCIENANIKRIKKKYLMHLRKGIEICKEQNANKNNLAELGM